MASYSQALTEDRRRALLVILRKSPGMTANAFVLRERLRMLGHDVAMDQVRADLTWLDNLALVALVDDAPLCVATLTEYGDDAAHGRVRVAGVAQRVWGD